MRSHARLSSSVTFILVAALLAALALPSAAHADAAKCRREIAKRSSQFALKQMKIVRSCEDRVLTGKSAGPCPDAKAAAQIAAQASKLHGALAKRCGGPDRTCGSPDDVPLADIGWDIGSCPSFVSGGCDAPIAHCGDVATCLACIDGAAVDQAADLAYDAFTSTPDRTIQKCQRTIGKETAKLFDKTVKALAKCEDGILAGKTAGPCPDAKATALIARARDKAGDKICKACGGSDRACGVGGDDLDPDAIGVVSHCPLVTVPGGPACGEAIDDLDDLVACVRCVTDFESVCLDAVGALALKPYPPECAVPQPPACALAKAVTHPAELLEGPLARGRVGDLLLANDEIQVIVQQPGRAFGFGPYGGNIIDADLQRPGEPARDNFEELVPGINIENTPHFTDVTILNDGANCAPAVIRFTGVDDLYDFVNGSSAIRDMGFFFPPGADDRDLPVAIQTDYTLATGARHVRMDTTITNLGVDPLSIYFIEYINGSGQVEMWRPAYGFGEPLATTTCPASNDQPCAAGTCDVCNFIAFSGEDEAAGVSYGYIHTANRTSEVTVSGVVVPVLGQEVAAVFLGADNPNFHMGPAGLPGDSVTVTRYFAVGDGTVASIADVRNAIQGITTGRLEGTVTAGGQPVADADVVVLGTAYPSGPDKNITNHFRTAADGTYGGTLPAGSYTVRVNKDGRLFGSPDPASVTVPVAGTAVQNFTLPDPGFLHVTITDESGQPIPAKVQLVGFDPSPDPRNVQDVLGAITNTTGVFGDVSEDSLAYGIAFVTFADRTGDTGAQEVEPGDYQLVVSRGPRYSAFLQNLTITAGQTTTVAAQIARVVDTPGFVGSDFHVHAIDSPDSEVTRAERVATMLAEGMDFFTPSDHEVRSDFAPTIAAMGVGDLIAVAPSAEITTFDYGHFNAWPVTIDPAQIQGGVVDWGRPGAVVGQDFPSYGSYVLSPAEIIAAGHADTPGNVVQINHMESHFEKNGLDVDTAEGGTGPPQSHQDPAVRRLDPSLPNLFSTDFDALEVWIGTNGSGGIATLRGRNMGDWFNLLNQGFSKSGVTSSDTHDRRTTQINARSYVASAVTDPGLLDAEALNLAAAVRAGRVIGTNAPFVTVTASAASTGESAGLALGLPTMVGTTDGAVDVTVSVRSPLWAEFDRIEFFVNNAPQPFDADGDGNLRNYQVSPDVVHVKDTDFTVTTVNDFPAIPGAGHLEATTTLGLTGLTEDSWVVVMVRGTSGVSRPTFPVLPNNLNAASNPTLADLTDGNLGEGGMLATAYTNPLYLDVGDDGVWTPPGVQLTPP